MTRVAARGAARAAIAGEIITFDTSTVIEHRQLPTTPSCTQPQPIVRDNLAEHNINLSPKKSILGKCKQRNRSTAKLRTEERV